MFDFIRHSKLTRTSLRGPISAILRALAESGERSDLTFRVQLYQLLLQCCEDAEEWEQGLAAVTEAFQVSSFVCSFVCSFVFLRVPLCAFVILCVRPCSVCSLVLTRTFLILLLLSCSSSPASTFPDICNDHSGQAG